MIRPLVSLAWAATLFAVEVVASLSESPFAKREWGNRNRLRCETASFTGLLPPNVTIETVAAVPEGGSYGEGSSNIPYPVIPTNLPALCAVTVRVRSSPSSGYRFGLFLPNEWDSRLLVVGNGGFAGGIAWSEMASGPHFGMATISTDTGHSSSSTDTSWALNQPERREDWGWRAIHGSTVLGKQLVQAYYGNKPVRYSYYSGCSTGGRQGLKEIQNFPDSFDGALIGAPAWWTSHVNNYLTQVGIWNLPATDPKHLTAAHLSLIAAEVVRQCDGLDRVKDGIVSSPESCSPDLTTLLCARPGQNTSTCLNRAQIMTVHNLYNPYVSSTDRSLLYPGFTPSSEAQWGWAFGSNVEPSPYGVGYQRNFLLDDPTWDWRSFNESLIALAERTDPGNATADDYGALAAFRRRGGKMIMYTGLADGLLPAQGTQLYYNRTVNALGGGGGGRGHGRGSGVQDFLRLFLVPGLQHCFSTAVNAPWAFGAAFQGATIMGPGVWSVPGFEDAEHDAVLALVDWVEHGRPVDKIIATTWREPLNPASGVLRQRPICPWPQKAVYKGYGNVDRAESWRCSEVQVGDGWDKGWF